MQIDPSVRQRMSSIPKLARELLQDRLRLHPNLRPLIETEAAAIAYIVSQVCGFNPGNASVDYSRLYNGNADILRGSLGRIQRLARLCLTKLGVGAFAGLEPEPA